MTFRNKLLVALGMMALGLLAWRVDVGAVQTALVHVGWGMTLIVGQEIVAHLFNALAWRFAFAPDQAGSFSLRELVRLRITGDAVNYLTPTATLGGEVARAALMRDAREPGVGAVSVIIAKSTQTLAQAVFITAGLGFVASEWLSLAMLRSALPWMLVALVSLGMLGLYGVRARSRAEAWWTVQWAFGAQAVKFIRLHPHRVALSTVMFALGYAWGAFEAFWICRFLGLRVSVVTAVAIEVLSITVDGILFMVPAKIGTQEGGKVAVFAALGLPVTLGFAFGVARHVRELAWAGLGVILYWAAMGRESASGRRAALGSPCRSPGLQT